MQFKEVEKTKTKKFISVVISIINEFNLVPLLNTLDVISEKNGNASIIIENQENSELALNQLKNNIDDKWHFNWFLVILDTDLSSLISKINAKSLSLYINTEKENISYKINEGVESLSLSLTHEVETKKIFI